LALMKTFFTEVPIVAEATIGRSWAEK